MKFTLLLYVLVLSSSVGSSNGRVIYVDANRGINNSSCWNGGQMLPCQNLSLAFEGLREENCTTVFIENGTYTLYPNHALTTFQWMEDITIEAHSPGEVEIYCEPGAGLAFIYSNNVSISNIEFKRCAALRTSTSKDFRDTGSLTFLEFHAGLYFLLCEHISLVQVTITETNGIGVVMYSTVGNNVITDCVFQSNKVDNSTLSGGGGLYIEFSYCVPDIGNCSEKSSNVPSQYTSNAYYDISGCSFRNNAGNVTNEANSTFILPQKINHLAFGRGGGLSIFFKGNANNNTVSVRGSTHTNNQALWGAGLFVEYQDMSHNNTFEIYNSTFEGNECYNSRSALAGTGGGGARVGYIFFNDTHVRNNNLYFETCRFLENSAYFGGGLSFYAAREPTENAPTNTLSFTQCSWKRNVARVGSGVDLSVWHPVPIGAAVKTTFHTCIFHQNNASYTQDVNSIIGVGAVYLDSLPALFTDTVFEENSHSALAAISTGIYFNSTANFTNNSGRVGGAIALFGYTFIETSPETKFNFINNSAKIHGGAISSESIGQHDLINSRNCFIRFSDIATPGPKWTSRFYFEGNTANGESNSIHATSLLPCLWGSSHGSTKYDPKVVFCWNTTTWLYKGSKCSNEISTAPARFSNVSDYHINAIPGKREMLPVVVLDDLSQDITDNTVLVAAVDNYTHLKISSSYYISDDAIQLQGEPHTTGVVSLETADPGHVLETKVNVTVLPCPPGMVQEGQGNETVCKCKGDYGGQILCYGAEFRAKLLRGSWIGSYDDHEDLLVGQCPYCSLITDQQYFYLPRHTSNLTEALCGKINRKGSLCGRCKENYGPAITSGSFECVKCNSTDWIFYLLTEFLPLTIFFFIVVLFNISITSAPANAFIFAAQILPTTFKIDGDGAILLSNITGSSAVTALKDAYVIPYDIWNLDFFRTVLPKYCLSSNLTTLQLIAMGYITAVYPLLLIGIFYAFVWLYDHGVRPLVFICRPIHNCFAKFRRIWDLRRSIIHAFASFLLLSYTQFTLVSLFLLTSTPLLHDQGNTAENVLYYDGTIGYLSKDHIPYLVSAVFVLATFVAIPPIVLIAPPLLRILQRFLGYQLCPTLQPGPKLQEFLNAFQGCYKDGTEADNKYDFRWFAGVYFLLRIILFVVYAFTPDWFMQYTLQQFVCIAGILLFSLFCPYKQGFYNKLDAIMFAILAGINTLTMYNYYLTVIAAPLSVWAFAIQYVLIWTPLLYIAVFLIYYFWRMYGSNSSCVQWLKDKLVFPWAKNKANINNREALIAGDSQDEFLAYTQGTGRLHGRNRYHRPPNLKQGCVALINSASASSHPSDSQSQYGTTQTTSSS